MKNPPGKKNNGKTLQRTCPPRPPQVFLASSAPSLGFRRLLLRRPGSAGLWWNGVTQRGEGLWLWCLSFWRRLVGWFCVFFKDFVVNLCVFVFFGCFCFFKDFSEEVLCVFWVVFVFLRILLLNVVFWGVILMLLFVSFFLFVFCCCLGVLLFIFFSVFLFGFGFGLGF